MTEFDKIKITAVDVGVLRRSCRISTLDRVRNERVRAVMNVVNTILDEIETKQLIWCGHRHRTGDERIPKMTYQWVPSGRRKRERSVRT